MATLSEIRAKLLEQETRSTSKSAKNSNDKAIFPHWNIPEGTNAVVRFLPDAEKATLSFGKSVR